MKIEEKYNKKVILIHVNSPNISSTMIREKIRDGKKVDNLLSKNVLNIIKLFLIQLGLVKKKYLIS